MGKKRGVPQIMIRGLHPMMYLLGLMRDAKVAADAEDVPELKWDTEQARRAMFAVSGISRILKNGTAGSAFYSLKKRGFVKIVPKGPSSKGVDQYVITPAGMKADKARYVATAPKLIKKTDPTTSTLFGMTG
jgi:hypothetical protein